MKSFSFAVLFLITLSGCTAVHDIEYPHPVVEHNHPFPFSQYQVEQTETTQSVLKNRSDDVVIREHSEYVIWTRSDNTSMHTEKQSEATQPQPDSVIEEPEIEVAKSEPQASIEPTESPEIVKQTVTCKSIMCDDKSDAECGNIAYCDGAPCEAHIDRYYDCTGANCLPLYIVNKDPGQCSRPYDSVNPDCMGKGEGSCAKHPELFMCNPNQHHCGE